MIENNIPQNSSEKRFVFEAPPGSKGKCSFGSGKSLASGEYEITAAGVVELKTGPAKWNPKFSDNCRILTTPDESLFRSELVENCPKAAPLSSAACKVLGTYTKSSKSGTSSASYETRTTVEIERDYFYSSVNSTSRSTCYGSNCKYLYSSDKPTVGTWKLSASSTIESPSLDGYQFSPKRGRV